MTKAEFVKALKETAKLNSLAQAEAAYNSVFAAIAKSLKKGEAVTIVGFGSFKVVKRAARKGRNPQTGKELTIKAHKAVKFTPSKKMKESL
ncbi:MAG: HU family DNA-binding protein [Desulfovibrionaceae bacterium]|nr:HU family DNA-binding protein [Desulfovibrionaceae bacterium]